MRIRFGSVYDKAVGFPGNIVHRFHPLPHWVLMTNDLRGSRLNTSTMLLLVAAHDLDIKGNSVGVFSRGVPAVPTFQHGIDAIRDNQISQQEI